MEMPEWLSKETATIRVNDDARVLTIDSEEALNELKNKYGTYHLGLREPTIDYNLVKEDYDIIEFKRSDSDYNFNFYASGMGDCDQTCILNKDVIEEIETSLISFWNATKETLKNAINPAYFYSTENPYIKVNTNDLRYYGDRLYNINNRVKDIDRRIHALYGQVNLLDILNLIQADILIGHSYRIDNCQNYLYDTASYFEQAEHNISSSID